MPLAFRPLAEGCAACSGPQLPPASPRSALGAASNMPAPGCFPSGLQKSVRACGSISNVEHLAAQLCVAVPRIQN